MDAADRELLGMAPPLLHLLPLAGRLLCAQHVRGRGGGELPPVSGGAGERGEGPSLGQTGSKDGEKETK